MEGRDAGGGASDGYGGPWRCEWGWAQGHGRNWGRGQSSGRGLTSGGCGGRACASTPQVPQPQRVAPYVRWSLDVGDEDAEVRPVGTSIHTIVPRVCGVPGRPVSPFWDQCRPFENSRGRAIHREGKQDLRRSAFCVIRMRGPGEAPQPASVNFRPPLVNHNEPSAPSSRPPAPLPPLLATPNRLQLPFKRRWLPYLSQCKTQQPLKRKKGAPKGPRLEWVGARGHRAVPVVKG